MQKRARVIGLLLAGLGAVTAADADAVIVTESGIAMGAPLSLQQGASISNFSTDGSMVGNSNAAVPTEQAVKTYVDAAVAAGGAPTATVIWSAANTAPAGYLACDGSAVSRTAYARLFAAIGTTYGSGDGSSTFNLPDLRGEFVRGWDNERGIDAGRNFGSWQEQDIQPHDHWNRVNATIGPRFKQEGGSADSANSASVGNGIGSSTLSSSAHISQWSWTNGSGAETRPRNIALLPCIKH